MSSLFWFREDLRLRDNLGLDYILSKHKNPLLVYIYEEFPLESERIGGASQYWLHHSLESLKTKIQSLGSDLILLKGDPFEILDQFVQKHHVKTISWNRLYTPHAIQRDTKIKSHLMNLNVEVKTFPGNVLLEPFQAQTQNAKPYQVYTPFSKFYFAQPDLGLASLDVPSELAHSNCKIESCSLQDFDLLPMNPNWAKNFGDYSSPGEEKAWELWEVFVNENLKNYRISEDLSAKTSCLSPHLRSGEISVRRIWFEIERLKEQMDINSPLIVFQKELIWRDFANHLLYHFPRTIHENMRPQFDAFPWAENSDHFKAWCKGLTGYPLVDAGMRELWQTGFMQNRVRMVTASFLVKHLLIDWRKGERWFWDTLLDADLASNIMNWQWVAGCGADAAPYFRIFNPLLQAKKFDPDAKYIQKWVPELRRVDAKTIHEMTDLFTKTRGAYPRPIVKHEEARGKALAAYESLKE